MKILFAIVAVFAVAMAPAQNPDTTPTQPPRLRESIDSEITREMLKQPAGQSPFFLGTPRANEVKLGGVSCEGILVQMAKSNPLELINPAAPPEYGSPIDNVTWDLTGQRVTGWKLFAIRF